MNINKENDGGSSVVNKLKSRFDPISCHQSKQLRGVSVPVVFLFGAVLTSLCFMMLDVRSLQEQQASGLHGDSPAVNINRLRTWNRQRAPQGARCVYRRPNTPPCQTPAASVKSNKNCCSLTWALRILCDPPESKTSERLLQMSGQSVCICRGFLMDFYGHFFLSMSDVQTPKEAPPPEAIKAADNSLISREDVRVSRTFPRSGLFVWCHSACLVQLHILTREGASFPPYIVSHIRDMQVI